MKRWGTVAIFVLALICAAQLVRGWHAYSVELRNFRPHRGPVPRPTDAAQLGLQDVSFPNGRGGLLHGWYIPSRSGAAVVLCHGTDSDRSTMLSDARSIAKGGMGVLLFDWPGHGESDGGKVTFGAAERDALERAVDFLSARPDVDSRRIGAVGFSMGGYILTQVASHDARLRAIVLEGAYGDEDEQTRADYARSGSIPTLGALLASRVGGMDVNKQRPLDVISRISPRPIVLVVGSADVTVPPALSRQLYDAALAPKQFWLIAGARHGRYSEVDSTYGARLGAFFTSALVAPVASRDDTPVAPRSKRQVQDARGHHPLPEQGIVEAHSSTSAAGRAGFCVSRAVVST